MPLSSPEPRRELHLRDVQMRGYQRDDGLIDIEGRITDRKTDDFKINIGKLMPKMVAFHDMSVRLTIDLHLNVIAAIATSDATPYTECPPAADNVVNLVGANMGRGWSREVRTTLAGTLGCTHIVELLIAMGTVAFQTLAPLRRDNEAAAGATGVPRIIDSCLGWSGEGPVVTMMWPQHARPPKGK